MSKKMKLITDLDMERLSSIIRERVRDRDTEIKFEDILSHMDVVERSKAPPDLVTMNSMIRGTIKSTDNTSDEARAFTLVYPRTANITDGSISILTPMGMQLLGARCGDIVNWRGNDGDIRKMVIEEVVYQPEASGDWNL